MPGLIAQAREQEGWQRQSEIDAWLPMPVWDVDFEIEREQSITASQRAVLGLIEIGVGDLAGLTSVLGLGRDVRLVETTLVRLLAVGAIEPRADAFSMTAAGKAWLNLGAISQRERVRFDVRFDPALGRFEWPGNERQAFADKEAWTIDLPTVEDRELLARKPELGALVRNEGLPDDEDRAPADRRKQVDLLALAIVSRRTHWRSVRIDLWQKTGTSLQQLIASVNGAEHERLTLLMAGYRLDEVRRRVVAPVRR